MPIHTTFAVCAARMTFAPRRECGGFRRRTPKLRAYRLPFALPFVSRACFRFDLLAVWLRKTGGGTLVFQRGDNAPLPT